MNGVKMTQDQKISFHGSRSLADERIRIIILEEIDKHKPSMIVTHAEPGGVCALARKIAKERSIPLKLHFLNFKFLRGAFEHRSKEVIADCDHAIFIHDGQSKGTANEISLAKKMNVSNTIHVVPVTRFKSSVGFDIDKAWESTLDDVKLFEQDDII
jgi:hypothetical protein